MTPVVLFALASALHAGFQLAVTVVVYPGLRTHSPADWETAHRRHSAAITPVVAVVYLALAVTGVVLVIDGPGVLGWCGLAGAGLAVVLTAAVAAPLHGRLTARDDALVARLLAADRWRCGAAVVGAAAAVAAVAAA